jgi:hypothetical protein
MAFLNSGYPQKKSKNFLTTDLFSVNSHTIFVAIECLERAERG